MTKKTPDLPTNATTSLKGVGTLKDTATVTIRHLDYAKRLVNPDGTPMTVVLYGQFSKRYKTVMRELQQARMLGTAPEGEDSIEDMQRALAAKCIVSWDITLDGADRLPFTPENVEMVEKEYPWVIDQLVLAQGVSSDFLEPPKEN